jgi:hypothetical protein
MKKTRQVAKGDGVLPAGSMDRRRFLSRTLAAGGALMIPQFVPASVLGRGGAVAPSERIVMAAIGIGGRAGHVLGWMLSAPEVQVVTVAEVQKARRDNAKQRIDGHYGSQDCVVYRDFRELLAERDDVDAVMIATCDRWHGLASTLAMQAGKDVYCEKPSCLTIAEGQRVVDAVRRYGRIFQTGTQRLSEAHHVFAIEMARSGRLGPLHTVYADCRWTGGSRHDWLPEQPLPPREEVDWDLWLGPSPERPYNAAYVTGMWAAFYDFSLDVAQWGSHTVAQCVAGLELDRRQPLEIRYEQGKPNLEVHFADGLHMVLYREGAVNVPCSYWHGSCGERFDGAEGWIAAADGYTQPDVSSPDLLAAYRQVLAEYTARTGRPLHHFRDFLDAVRTRRRPVADEQMMYDSMCICLAADIAIHLKRDVQFSLAAGAFVDDAQADRMRDRAVREGWLG